jgi:hypothetical protein
MRRQSIRLIAVFIQKVGVANVRSDCKLHFQCKCIVLGDSQLFRLTSTIAARRISSQGENPFTPLGPRSKARSRRKAASAFLG